MGCLRGSVEGVIDFLLLGFSVSCGCGRWWEEIVFIVLLVTMRLGGCELGEEEGKDSSFHCVPLRCVAEGAFDSIHLLDPFGDSLGYEDGLREMLLETR